MIRWITESLGTAKRDDIDDDKYHIVDVRDLVDKEGNSSHLILEKINNTLYWLRKNQKVIICCDYGKSRSNAIAIGVIERLLSLSFYEAVTFVMEKTKEDAIQIGLLNSVRHAIRKNEKDRISSKNNKNILITGSTGFIGSALVSKIKNTYNLVLPTKEELDLLKGAINFDTMVKENEVDTIIHLANPKIFTTAESLGQSLIMLKNVLDVCKENHLNLIYLSGWVVYSGYNSSHLIAGESLAPRPKGTYGEMKALCDILVAHYQEIYDLKIYLLRLGNVYGIGSDKPKFIHTYFKNALHHETIFTHKYINGFPKLDLLHINDAIRAIECIIGNAPPISFECNIGSGVGCSTFEIAKMIKKLCSSDSKIRHHEINDYYANIVMDISKARKVLGWYPTTSIEDGLKEMMNHLRERSVKNDK